jgi:hypothetical protein
MLFPPHMRLASSSRVAANTWHEPCSYVSYFSQSTRPHIHGQHRFIVILRTPFRRPLAGLPLVPGAGGIAGVSLRSGAWWCAP